MKNLLPYFLLAILITGCFSKTPSNKVSQISIIPKPAIFVLGKDSFEINSKLSISIDNDLQSGAANLFNELLQNTSNYKLEVHSNNEKAAIQFKTSNNIKAEGYQLSVTSSNIIITANDAAGYFYAVQTLRQLLPASVENKNSGESTWLIPSVRIGDEPRFAWRGMHMDFSRHFFALEEVKLFLDYMAMYKLNTFHMHLTDDQGWRIEIKKYPLLTEKGAWRTENGQDKYCIEQAKTNPLFKIDERHYQEKDGEKKYGGFYTQEQIKEIVAYASSKNIEVIPEIDMPGHLKAAIDNYTFLSCTNEAGWGTTFSKPACLGKESSYDFAKDVLSEIATLFPSQYIHIGGDEVNTEPWETCSNCQNKIKDNHLKNEHELQSYFNREIEAFLATKGKKLIGWDEIVEGGISKDATMMWWRNWATKELNVAAANGNDMVITPNNEYYFDHSNKDTPLAEVYNYDPLPSGFSAAQKEYILGVQANLWSEYIPNFKRLQYQAFPRMLALAETAWSSKNNLDFEDFSSRINFEYDRLDNLGIHYFIPNVEVSDKIAFLDNTTVTLNSKLNSATIYYTLDGSAPTMESLEYREPFKVSENRVLKIITYKGTVFSEIKTVQIEKQTFLEPIADYKPSGQGIKRWVAKERFKTVTDVKLPAEPEWETVSDVSLKGHENKQNISMIFKGQFFAKEDGMYTFETKSDDGSLLYINDKLVVDNGGNHSATSKNGMVAIKKGWHPITIKYNDAGGDSSLSVSFTSPLGLIRPINNEFVSF